MNEKQKEIRLKRIEKFGDAIAGGISALAVASLFHDGKIVINNIGMCSAALFWAFIIYWVFSWLLEELAKSLDSDGKPVSSSEDD